MLHEVGRLNSNECIHGRGGEEKNETLHVRLCVCLCSVIQPLERNILTLKPHTRGRGLKKDKSCKKLMFQSFRPAQETLMQHNPFPSMSLSFSICSVHFSFPAIEEPPVLLYLLVGQGPGLGLVACGVAAAQRRQVLHDGVQRLLLDCAAEGRTKRESQRGNDKQENSRERCLAVLAGRSGQLGNAAGTSFRFSKVSFRA